MSSQRFAPAARASTTGVGTSSGGASMAALYEEIPRRLGLFALSLAFIFFVGALMNAFAADLLGWDEECAAVGVAVNTLIVIDALFVAKLSFKRAFSPRTLSVIGLSFFWAVALGVSFSEAQQDQFNGISFNAVLIVLYPLFVPATLRMACVGVFGAVIAGFGGEVIHHAIKDENVWASMALIPHVANVGAATLALVPTTLLRALGRRVAEARQLGAYALVERIGEGAMGEVWRASHRLLRRPAAVKLIRPEALGAHGAARRAQLLARFEREAQATAELHSAHTIAIYDFGVTQEGHFYYVMELLEGLDLRSLVEQHGPLPAERAVAMLLQVCDSLEDAHLSGLVHRDVKPANIFACRYGHKFDFVKVLDFGLVKSKAGGSSDDAQLTHDGQAAGTPACMAPEVAMAEAEADERADVYALGCVAYWLLTGAQVFDAQSSLKMMMMHVQDTPVPPSERVEMAVPPALDALVMACLAKDPRERPQTAAELAERLLAVALQEPWTQARAARWWGAHQPVPQPHATVAPEAESGRTLVPQLV